MSRPESDPILENALEKARQEILPAIKDKPTLNLGPFGPDPKIVEALTDLKIKTPENQG